MEKLLFNPEKLQIGRIQIEKASIESPFGLMSEQFEEFKMEMGTALGFSPDTHTIKSDFSVRLSPVFREKEEVVCFAEFQFTFIFSVENFEELIQQGKDGKLIVDRNLLNAVTSITYSTTRGILFTRLQGTVFQNFILPIVNSNELIEMANKK